MSTRTPEQLYETDFYAWTQAQARELRRFARTRPNLPLDLEHLAEEVQDLGKSERDAVFSLAQRILEHLLLIEHSPAADQRLHWMDEVDEFRAQIPAQALAHNPPTSEARAPRAVRPRPAAGAS